MAAESPPAAMNVQSPYGHTDAKDRKNPHFLHFGHSKAKRQFCRFWPYTQVISRYQCTFFQLQSVYFLDCSRIYEILQVLFVPAVLESLLHLVGPIDDAAEFLDIRISQLHECLGCDLAAPTAATVD